MKIMITGATGFVGQHLLDALSDSGHELRLLTRSLAPRFWARTSNVSVATGDVGHVDGLLEALDGVDVLVNLAGEFRDESQFQRTNVTGVANLLLACRARSVRRIIHLSSVGVVGQQYSRSRVVVDEQTLCVPANEYERTKLAAELLLQDSEYWKQGSCVILRPTNIFGDAHPRNALLALLARLQARRRLVMEREAIVNYVYVRDVAAAIVHGIEHSSMSGTYMVGRHESLTDFATRCAAALQVEPALVGVPSSLFDAAEALGYLGVTKMRIRLRSVSNQVVYDDARLRSVFTYPFDLGEGIIRTAGYYVERGMLRPQ